MANPDRAVEHIARRQHGAFNLSQARTAGFTKAKIQQRTGAGAWQRKARGVYVLAAVRPTWEQRLMVAVLSQPDASVSHLPAMALHHAQGFARCKPELTVPPNANHRSPLAVIHRSHFIDRTVVDGIPVVTLLQSLFDVAGSVPEGMVFEAAEHAIMRGRVQREQLADRFVELAPRLNQGIGDMRSIVERLCDDSYVPAQSSLEALLFDLLDELGVRYVRQFATDWRSPTPMIVDALAPSLALITEADGRTWHGRLAALDTDRIRDNSATARGFSTMRFTHTMLTSGRDQSRAALQEYIDHRREMNLSAPAFHARSASEAA